MNCATKGCPPLREGSRVCHCAACHETFGTLTLFDAHRVRDYTLDSGGSCLEPAALGLVWGAGAWRTPEGLQSTTRKAGILALARERRVA